MSDIGRRFFDVWAESDRATQADMIAKADADGKLTRLVGFVGNGAL